MIKQDWWLDFFEGAQSECTLTTNTRKVVDFVATLCQLGPHSTLLDQCCGKGALAHAFSKTGLTVTGVDASTSYIAFAKANFQSDTCHFVHADARDFRMEAQVDLALNWNTSFAYTEDDHENMRMLSALSDNLKTGGKFVIATLNPDYILANFQRFIVKSIDYQESTIIAIRESYIEHRMMKSDWLFIYPDGTRITRFGQTKMYNLADFNAMLSKHNLLIENVYGTLQFEAFSQYSPSLILYGRKVVC